MWSEVEVLKLAAGVESNTIHPVGKAIVEAAQAASCTSVKVHMHLVEVFHVIVLGKHGNK